MKKKWLPIFSLLFVIACNDSKQKSEKIPIEKVEINESVEILSKETQSDILSQNHWISDQWLKNIERDKSIFTNSELPTKTQMMGFNFVDKIQGYGTHEGGYDSELIFDETKQVYKNDFTSMQKNFFEIPFTINIQEKSKIEFVFEDGQKNVYRSVKDFQSAFRSILLDGKYLDKDTKKEVEFVAEKGIIKGLEGKKTYEFLHDLFEFEFDVMKLDNDFYHYKIQENNITLYKIVEEEEMVFTWKEKSFEFKKVK